MTSLEKCQAFYEKEILHSDVSEMFPTDKINALSVGRKKWCFFGMSYIEHWNSSPNKVNKQIATQFNRNLKFKFLP